MQFSDSKNTISTILRLKPEDRTLAGLMAVYNFILLITLYLLKPVRDSLFLEQVGANELPQVFILTAIIVAPISYLYSRYSRKCSIGILINLVTIFLVANLIVLWWFINNSSQSIYYFFYIWVSIYSVLITSQFWLFANNIFNAAQAKRVFSLLSVSAIAGAIAGGEITGLLIDTFDLAPSNLMIIGAVLLLSTTFLVNAIHYINTGQEQERKKTEPKESDEYATDTYYHSSKGNGSMFSEVLRSRHLLYIIGIIGITVVVTTIVDFQFKTAASNYYANEADLTQFMGRFYGRVGILALLLQLLAGNRIVKIAGVGGAIALLPTILMLGAVGFVIFPGIIMATVLRGADQTFKHSIDRTGRELLFLPIKMNVKRRIKVFVDLFVDHGAQGLTGLLLILLTTVLNLNIQQIGFVAIGFTGVWLLLAAGARRSYINEFRKSLNAYRNAKLKTQQDNGRLSREKQMQQLYSNSESCIEEALVSLIKSGDPVPRDDVHNLINHDNDDIRRLVIRLFRIRGIEGYTDEFSNFQFDPDPEVRLEATRYIYKFSHDRLQAIKEGLKHKDVRIQATAIGLIAKDGGEEEKKLVTDDLLKDLYNYKGKDRDEVRYNLARIIGRAYTPERKDLLLNLMHDTSTAVVSRAILSAGESNDRSLLSHIIHFLNHDLYYKQAIKAISSFGNRIIGTMFDYLTEEDIPDEVQKKIPFVLEANYISAEMLQISMDLCKLPVRHQIIKVMDSFKQQNPSIKFQVSKIRKDIIEETRRYALLNQSLHKMRSHQHYEELAVYIKREISRSFDNIFHLLELLHKNNDIQKARTGISSNNPKIVSQSVEFLENLVDWDIRKYFQPILESYTSVRENYGMFNNRITNQNEAIDFLKSLKHPKFDYCLEKRTPDSTTISEHS